MCALKRENGNVFAWYVNGYVVTKTRHGSMDDAQKYAVLYNRLRDIRGRAAVTFNFGRERDYLNAVTSAHDRAMQAEADRYNEYITNLCAVSRAKINALEGLKSTVAKFDGKVINVRFLRAVESATGFVCEFREYRRLVLTDYNDEYCPHAEVVIFDWQWGTGIRLDADQASAVIEKAIESHKTYIDDLQRSIDYYSDYLRTARELAAQIKSLTASVPETLRYYAQEHDLRATAPIRTPWGLPSGALSA